MNSGGCPNSYEEGGVITTVAARRVGGAGGPDGPDGRTLFMKAEWRDAYKSFDLLIIDGTDAWEATGKRSRDRVRKWRPITHTTDAPPPTHTASPPAPAQAFSSRCRCSSATGTSAR
jgi:hypothetical protein